MLGLDKLIRELRETGDWLLSLPDKLVTMVMAPRETYLTRQGRTRKLKEIPEAREICKIIQHFYFQKADLLSMLDGIRDGHSRVDPRYIRQEFRAVREGIIELRKAILEADMLSHTALVVEGQVFLAKAERVYEALELLDDDAIMSEPVLREVNTILRKLHNKANLSIKQIDAYRYRLDHEYS